MTPVVPSAFDAHFAGVSNKALIHPPLLSPAEGEGRGEGGKKAGALGRATLSPGPGGSGTEPIVSGPERQAGKGAPGSSGRNGGGLNGEEVFVPVQIVGLKKPVYPEDSRRGRLGEEGTVLLAVTVSAEGKREKIRIVKSSGFSRLDQAAIAALESATFVPATRGGKPVSMEKKIAFTFRLEEEQ